MGFALVPSKAHWEEGRMLAPVPQRAVNPERVVNQRVREFEPFGTGTVAKRGSS